MKLFAYVPTIKGIPQAKKVVPQVYKTVTEPKQNILIDPIKPSQNAPIKITLKGRRTTRTSASASTARTYYSRAMRRRSKNLCSAAIKSAQYALSAGEGNEKELRSIIRNCRNMH